MTSTRAVKVVSPRTRSQSASRAFGILFEAIGWVVMAVVAMQAVGVALSLALALALIFLGHRLRALGD